MTTRNPVKIGKVVLKKKPLNIVALETDKTSRFTISFDWGAVIITDNSGQPIDRSYMVYMLEAAKNAIMYQR